MFVINEDNSIYVTRGDEAYISVTASNDESPHKFKAGDLLRIKVFAKKDCTDVVLQKDFPVTNETETVEIYLDKNDTKIGEVISKPKDLWYEIELNPLNNPQTIIGYDDEGAKVFKLFPEGRDLPEDEPSITPEDIPIVDTELDLTSRRPVENQAVAKAISEIRSDIKTEFSNKVATISDDAPAEQYPNVQAVKKYVDETEQSVRKSVDETKQAVKEYVDSVTDHIIEQGTDGIWTYEKKASGIVKLWGQTTSQEIKCDKSFYGNYYTEEHIDFPVDLFVGRPWVNVDILSPTGLAEAHLFDVTANGIDFRISSGLSVETALSVSCMVQAKGRWE